MVGIIVKTGRDKYKFIYKDSIDYAHKTFDYIKKRVGYVPKESAISD
jgi:hypothetical protein